jgi:hypothetical protein
MVTFYFCFLSNPSISTCIASGLGRTGAAVRSARTPIFSPDGDTIDCMHISHQPALDHRLLNNHTILVTLSTLQISSETKTNLQMVIFFHTPF